jgi:hypothetical protein
MQRDCIVEIYVRQKFYKYWCCSKFRSQFSSAPVPSKSTIYRIVKKFRIYSSLKGKSGRSRRVPADETLDTGASLLEAPKRKCLIRWLLLETGMSNPCVHIAAK